MEQRARRSASAGSSNSDKAAAASADANSHSAAAADAAPSIPQVADKPAALTSDEADAASGALEHAASKLDGGDEKGSASRADAESASSEVIQTAVSKSEPSRSAGATPSPSSQPSSSRAGHTLRRRTRVDYNQENDNSGSDAHSSPASRVRKRRSDNSIDQAAASLDGDSPSTSRRRNPSRKSSGVTSYTEPDDEVDSGAEPKVELETSLLEDAFGDALKSEDASLDHISSASKSEDGEIRGIEDGEVRLLDDISSDSPAAEEASNPEHTDDASADAAEQLQSEAQNAAKDSSAEPALDAENVEMTDADAEADATVPEASEDAPKAEDAETEPASMEGIESTAPEASDNKAKAEADVKDVEAKSEVKAEPEPVKEKPTRRQSLAPAPTLLRLQSVPDGRWAHLTPYVEDEYVTYPEKKEATPEGEGTSTPEEGTAAETDTNDLEPMVEDNDDGADAAAELATPALNTPTRGSPVPDSIDPTATNSPAPGMEDGDDGEDEENEEDAERIRYYRYRKLRDPEEYVTAVENYENMTTAELYELLEAVNLSLVEWQTEWTGLGKVVDDYENALRRRLADSKYESRTRNLSQQGVNYEEPEFVVKGYRAKDRDVVTETRYLQGQDRIMAASYGFEYDPHPSKIGRQNPEGQQFGVSTRGRSLRNQPRQTAKATEADEVTGKRLRKPVQLFDPAAGDASRSSTPVPRSRRRRGAGDDDMMVASSFNSENASDVEETPSRTRRRRAKPKTSAPGIIDEHTPYTGSPAPAEGLGRRGRVRPAVRYDEGGDDYDDEEDARPPRRHLLTLKIPRGKNFSEPSSALSDNGESRPSSAGSDSSSHTAESSYSFRPKRQKRFREELDETDASGQAPPKKRGKRLGDDIGSGYIAADSLPVSAKKPQKIKVVRTGAAAAAGAAASRNGTPSSTGADGEEPRKDYKLMTKSEKMSASMKSRWANGNMAGAVEKRKATLAAKKAAQAAADQKGGGNAAKQGANKAKPVKKDNSGTSTPAKQETTPFVPSGAPMMGNFSFSSQQ